MHWIFGAFILLLKKHPFAVDSKGSFMQVKGVPVIKLVGHCYGNDGLLFHLTCTLNFMKLLGEKSVVALCSSWQAFASLSFNGKSEQWIEKSESYG